MIDMLSGTQSKYFDTRDTTKPTWPVSIGVGAAPDGSGDADRTPDPSRVGL